MIASSFQRTTPFLKTSCEVENGAWYVEARFDSTHDMVVESRRAGLEAGEWKVEYSIHFPPSTFRTSFPAPGTTTQPMKLLEKERGMSVNAINAFFQSPLFV